MDSLKDFITRFHSNYIDNCVNLFFSRRSSTDKYITHQPVVSADVQRTIINTIFPQLIKQLESHNLVQYNPVGVLDGEIEKIEINKIPMYNTFLSSIEDANVFRDMSTLKVERIGFYCIVIKYDGSELFLFRQFQKLKKLRKGILTQILNNELNVIENEFLGIDEYVDIISYNGFLYLPNHISLERIFSYKDEFLRKTTEALGEILTQNVISNIEQFQQDCCNDIRIMKRFTNIMTKDRLPLFFDNYDRVPEIVRELGLDIEFDEEERIVYREKSQLFHIVNLLSDSYFKSLLSNRPGIAIVEEEIK